ncbi:hypothetical protein Pcar_0973 [Syntrophotalea carbinolica DSM 2380]|uniref:Uncharacterized protein n=1 Tax=Syntrophotalea carbinolica (strain DSM 2380 / NBRC 103641 / GraBd1) TaxID=338963 RepID=Q3A5Y1_SYNC1|nr:hypothetical protein [Syntrophotalea carbinolica]ABA88226.1 hypothetical protein Pcar_0973 [Syntrophotalea carbinolica DSM 2380]
MWYFFSPVGTFIIAIEPAGTFSLWIDTYRLGVFNAPEEAVDAVRKHKTGHAPWDELRDLAAPETLDEWMVMPGTAL